MLNIIGIGCATLNFVMLLDYTWDPCNFQNPGDIYVLHYVARILELVIPLMDHPSENFLMQVEEDMIKLILNHGMLVGFYE